MKICQKNWFRRYKVLILIFLQLKVSFFVHFFHLNLMTKFLWSKIQRKLEIPWFFKWLLSSRVKPNKLSGWLHKGGSIISDIFSELLSQKAIWRIYLEKNTFHVEIELISNYRGSSTVGTPNKGTPNKGIFASRSPSET